MAGSIPMGQTRWNSGSVERALETAYADFVAGMKGRNADLIARLLADNFSWRLLDGQVLNATETIAMVETLLSENVIADMTVRILEFRWDADREIACVRVAERVVSMPENAAGDGGTETLEELDESWMATRSGWRLLRSEVLQSRTGPVAK